MHLMAKKTLGWAFLFGTVLLLFCVRKFDSDSSGKKSYPSGIPKEQDAQPGISQIQPKSTIEVESGARKKADAAITNAIAVLKDIDNRETPEERRMLAELKRRRYEDLFKSWNLKPEAMSKALSVLETRNQRLDELNHQMLNGKLAPHVAAKEIIECKRGAEKELADIVGVELSVEFSLWEKPASKKK